MIPRDAAYVNGYRDYCREMRDRRVIFFVPSDPNKIDEGWFERTKSWYNRKELGL